MTARESSSFTRREFTRTTLGALSAVGLGACDEARGAACDGTAATWATGGTAAMTAQDCYPDPFAGAVQPCPLLCETIAGPCTADSPERRDISEGLGGLPVRLALRVVDAATCEPIAGAAVDIWHTNRAGIYSGATPSPICHRGDADAAARRFFRGTQTTDADGRVMFDTCFPGWYPGRTVHIHLRVRRGDVVHLTSQLFFADALVAEVFAEHREYREFGQPDTTNARDFVTGNAPDPGRYLLDVARMPDGAMLAAKVIALGGPDPACVAGP